MSVLDTFSLSGKVSVSQASLWLPSLSTGSGKNLQSLEDHPDLRFVDEMPRSTLEKVAKAELRKMLG